MPNWAWSASGTDDNYGNPRGRTLSGTVVAECGEHALHVLLAEIPGPWDELDTDEEFSVTIKPASDPT